MSQKGGWVEGIKKTRPPTHSLLTVTGITHKLLSHFRFVIWKGKVSCLQGNSVFPPPPSNSLKKGFLMVIIHFMKFPAILVQLHFWPPPPHRSNSGKRFLVDLSISLNFPLMMTIARRYVGSGINSLWSLNPTEYWRKSWELHWTNRCAPHQVQVGWDICAKDANTK